MRLLLLLPCSLFLLACQPTSAPTTAASSPAEAAPQPTAPQPLEGNWRVVRRKKVAFEFQFSDDHAAVKRPTDEAFVRGKASYPMPTRLVITTDQNALYFRYARAGDRTFIGRGDAHAIAGVDAFSLPVTARHRLTYQGGACQLVDEQGQETPATCDLDRDAQPMTFRFSAEELRDPGPQQGRRYLLVENVLISETLYQYEATRTDRP